MARLARGLDARNLICPMPVIRTQEHIKSLAPGDEFEVLATDPGALHDIPAWCRVHGHRIMSTEEDAPDIRIRIRIGG